MFFSLINDIPFFSFFFKETNLINHLKFFFQTKIRLKIKSMIEDIKQYQES